MCLDCSGGDGGGACVVMEGKSHLELYAFPSPYHRWPFRLIEFSAPLSERPPLPQPQIGFSPPALAMPTVCFKASRPSLSQPLVNQPWPPIPLATRISSLLFAGGGLGPREYLHANCVCIIIINGVVPLTT